MGQSAHVRGRTPSARFTVRLVRGGSYPGSGFSEKVAVTRSHDHLLFARQSNGE